MCGDATALGLSNGMQTIPLLVRLLRYVLCTLDNLSQHSLFLLTPTIRGKSISRVSCGSWMTAALTETGDLYTCNYTIPQLQSQNSCSNFMFRGSCFFSKVKPRT